MSQAAQHLLDEPAVVGDTPAIHDAGIQRLGVGHDDVLRAIRREEMTRPVRIVIVVQRLLAEFARLDL